MNLQQPQPALMRIVVCYYRYTLYAGRNHHRRKNQLRLFAPVAMITVKGLS